MGRRLSLLFAVTLCVHSAGAITFLVTTNADSGPGSLRQAILDANATPGPDAIHFSIGTGPQTINPTNALPAVTDTVTIDGTTQPGYGHQPIIELSGENASLTMRIGLTLKCSGTTVFGLVINRWSVGILIETGGSNWIAHNYIGTDLSGMFARRNGEGIKIRNSTGNQIGFTNSSSRNVVSGNQDGISIEGSTDTVVEGNFIGTARDGISPLPNSIGAWVYGLRNTIGGSNVGARNIISGNAVGIILNGAFNVLEGNFIGVDVSGLLRVPNAAASPPFATGSGVWITYGVTNTIGGTRVESRNVISGNGGYGIFVEGENPQGIVIQGNWIGLNAAGGSLSNAAGGIFSEGRDNLIGGTEAGAGNVISGNGFFGILLSSPGSNQIIQGNFVGTDSLGQSAIPNLGKGIVVNSVRNLIGGTESAARNVISGNVGPGIQVGGSDAIGNVIQGNLIGVNALHTGAVPNTTWGVLIVNGSFTTVGGSEAGAGNVISGNQSGGLWIAGFYAVTNVLHGNFIGTDYSGQFSIPNRGPGVHLASLARNNFVGGTTSGERNVIAFNIGDGVLVHPDAIGNPILANSIHSNARLGINLQPAGEGNGMVTANDVAIQTPAPTTFKTSR